MFQELRRRICWRLRLVPNWRQVLKYSWSNWLIVAASFLSAIEIALPLVREYIVDIPPGWFALASFVVTLTAFPARLVAQKSISGEKENGR